MPSCKAISCTGITAHDQDFCPTCLNAVSLGFTTDSNASLSKKYPKYFKDVNDVSEIDVYSIHLLFNIQDPSGCIQHASKKLLLSSATDKSMYRNVMEARDILTRWLQLHSESIDK